MQGVTKYDIIEELERRNKNRHDQAVKRLKSATDEELEEMLEKEYQNK